MSNQLLGKKEGFGTAPVFFSAISTILGAILFLRFGWAVGNLGLYQTIAIIILGHVVTIPTGMAIAEIATNQKVEGGGAYYMISRSFGLNIGAAIGVALYLAQAISVAFYVIAFSEAFRPVFYFMANNLGWHLGTTAQYYLVSVPTMLLLTMLFLTKGADIGIKVLYVVAAILFLSIIFFLTGKPLAGFEYSAADFTHGIVRHEKFFTVFTIVFPAFTGIAAGLGLSGDLKDPKKSLPRGTLWATLVGMAVYFAIAIKFATSAGASELADVNRDVMGEISIWGPIIPIGLACATISSALGSIMIAPRTLQALGADKIFPLRTMNTWFSKEKKGEPINAAALTCLVAFVFVILGGVSENGVNFVAEIIAMFFMVTYGAICLISFMEHFAADPAYRPTFKSRWYISLVGAVACIYLMFKMNPLYAFLSLALMVGVYLWITYNKSKQEGLATIFQGVIFQLSRRMQVFLQKSSAQDDTDHWRPSVVCISSDSFERFSAFNLLRWISMKYGFGTYIHFITGYLSKETNNTAREALQRLIKMAESSKSNVYLDTMISPSYTSAIAQVIQLPGISGKDNNMLMFEYPKGNTDKLNDVIDNMQLMKSTDFDLCILGSSLKGFGYHNEIHIWITTKDYENANLMILLGYIILGHPDWKRGSIKLFSIFPQGQFASQKEKLHKLVSSGRLPISLNNIVLIPHEDHQDPKEIVNERSKDADLTIVGFRAEIVKHNGVGVFEGYDRVGNVLFVNTNQEKDIS